MVPFDIINVEVKKSAYPEDEPSNTLFLQTSRNFKTFGLELYLNSRTFCHVNYVIFVLCTTMRLSFFAYRQQYLRKGVICTLPNTRMPKYIYYRWDTKVIFLFTFHWENDEVLDYYKA